MANLSGFLIGCDSATVAYEDHTWRIMRRCNRGYEPWFTLHKKRCVWRFEWWSGPQQWAMERKPLQQFVDRWNQWPGKGECDGNV